MKRTTFIIGAGASTDFDMPIGTDLAARIGQMLVNEIEHPDVQPIIQSAIATGAAGDIGVAVRDIAGGMVSARSIDRYLASRDDRPLVQTIGKRALAYNIAFAEGSSRLGQGNVQEWGSVRTALLGSNQSWLARLFAFLQEGVRPDRAASMLLPLKFVTFNYDRCIEQYLTLALHHIMNLPIVDARAVAASVPVVHIYGSLGELSSMPFGPTIDRLPETAANIRTFMEAADANTVQAAVNAIETAENVIVLGYGFDPQNNSMIFPSKLHAGQRIAGTDLGANADDRADFRAKAIGDSVEAGWIAKTAADFIWDDTFGNLVK